MKKLYLLLAILAAPFFTDAQTMDICGAEVPEGWISIAVKSTYCGSNGGYFYIGKTITRIDGAAPGTVLDICGSDVPEGWVAIAVKSSFCSTVGGRLFFGRTIKKIEGLPIGTTLNVCGTNPPKGWIQTAVTGSCSRVGGYIFTGTTIQKISGMVDQTLTFNPLPAVNFGSADIAPVASTTSALPVSFSSSNPAVAGIVNGKIRIYGAGTTYITASQGGNNAYTPAPEVTQLLTVNKVTQGITFPAIPLKPFQTPDFSPGASANSGLPVTYSSGDPAVATIIGDKIHIVGTGSSAITASQAGNDNFHAATNVTQVLTVSKAAQNITFAPIPAKTTGAASFSPGATASSGLAITYTSSNKAVATIVSQKINIVGVGTSTITASQAGNSSYNAAPNAAQVLTVKSPQTITFKPTEEKLYGDAEYVPAAKTSSGLPLSFTSSNTKVATIVNGKIRITGVGISTIVASQAGNASFAPATSVSQQLTVKKGNQTITFAEITKQTVGNPDFAPGATASSGLAVSYTSSNTAVATIVNGKIRLLSSGQTNIVAAQAGNTLYNAATSVTRSLTVNKASQTITFKEIPPKLVGVADFAPDAKASSGLEVTYTSSNTAVATIVAGKIHVIKEGTSSITAIQAGNSAYLAAAKVIQTLTVTKADQTITFKAFTEKQATAADFAPNASASSKLPLSFTSSDLTVATIVSGKVHLVGAGTTTITASQAGNAAFNVAKKVSQLLTVVKVGQKIYFPVISIKAHGAADFDPAAKASSGLPVSYRSSNTSVATVVNGKVHIITTGEAIITASQKGNNVYEPASSVSQALTIGKASQTITFKAIPEKLVGAAVFDPAATSSSGLKVLYTSSNTAVAKIVNGKIQILKSGLTNIVASQPGNLTFEAAPTVSRPLVVKKNKQTITFNAIPTKVVGSPDFDPGAKASSGLKVTYKSSATVVATIVNGKVHIIKDGGSIITASQEGDDFWEAATIVSQKLTVVKPNAAPEITVSNSPADMAEIVPATELPALEVFKAEDIQPAAKPAELIYKIYPNPASHQIYIENESSPDQGSDASGKIWIRIFNSRGSLEKEVITNEKKVMIPIENIPEGSHLIRITNGRKEVTKHILIRH
ncbi:T9SS type A sorting domain-containing protein [Dyadobacter sp. CY261]|uniref:T9SS type A sorting domain-containing protein n=1 Tax=Dyadobacter sp. CY261 TaxID=2907203 RepID=UPI001F27F9F8|nr:T9SS type A sorting domain-containing protein [Dyadobacter sp. CY261]MCF0074303.1 T9SS type A sorting domain-containing protein [Dyadobacter sp. CY261]